MYMIHHRIPESRLSCQRETYLPARRKEGMAPYNLEDKRVRRECWDQDIVVYRAPTYRDAQKFWKIPHSTITHWWRKRAKYLPAAEIARAKDCNPLSGFSIGETSSNPPVSRPSRPASGQQAVESPPNGLEPIDLDDSSDDSDAPEEFPGDEGGNLDDDLGVEDADRAHVEAEGDAEATRRTEPRNDEVAEDAPGEDMSGSAEVYTAIFDLPTARTNCHVRYGLAQ